MTKIEPYLLFSIYVLPVALVTGPFLSDLITSILAIYFIFLYFHGKLKKFIASKLFYLFLLFYFFLIISSFLSENIKFSLESSLFYFRFIFFSICLAYFINKYPRSIINLFIVIMITVSLLIIDAFYEFIFGFNLIGLTNSNLATLRISSFFGDQQILGHYLARIIPISFILLLMLENVRKMYLIVFFIILILSDIIIYISGDRSAFFLLNLSTILAIILLNKFKYIRLLSFVISTIIIISLTVFSVDLYERNISRTIDQITEVPKVENPVDKRNKLENKTFNNIKENNYFFSKFNFFSVDHTILYKTGFNMFLDKPTLGHGPKMFRLVCNNKKYFSEKSCSTHPHNSYIQILAEVGIIGFTFIFGLFIFVSVKLFLVFINKVYASKKFVDYIVMTYIVIFTNLWPILPSFNLFGNWISILYFIPISFLFLKKNDLIIFDDKPKQNI